MQDRVNFYRFQLEIFQMKVAVLKLNIKIMIFLWNTVKLLLLLMNTHYIIQSWTKIISDSLIRVQSPYLILCFLQ